MVQQKESVVTADRFAQGLTYDGFIKAIDRNQQRFQENYDGTQVSPDDTAKLKSLMAKPHGPAKIVLIGEPWCPDVFRGAPVFARIAEASGMELRIFFRDQNKDMIAEFRNGDFESIPVAVFYTKDMEYIAHWIELCRAAGCVGRRSAGQCVWRKGNVRADIRPANWHLVLSRWAGLQIAVASDG